MAFTPCSPSHSKIRSVTSSTPRSSSIFGQRPRFPVITPTLSRPRRWSRGPTGKFREACVRCPVLIGTLEEKPRLEEIRDNLKDRIAEAEREGWFGEIDGLSTSLAAAEDKIAQIEAQQEKKQSPVFLGLPSLSQLTARAGEANE
ncbi:hypothetical protein ACFQ60_02770 [Streptomyces zhihengii]|uniref:hypothetical protein n=1 Tax=Streptomyces zhihengii TaxID=1818004 RepID=UPI001FD15F88|nr:hypothetical protein [Streptomyces zhihengii]